MAGLFDGLNGMVMNPLFMGGLGLLSGGGGQGAMQGMQQGLLAQRQMREDDIKRQREAAFGQLMQDPQWASGLPKAAVPLAGAMGSDAALPFLGGLLAKKGDNEHAMQLFEQQKKLAFGLERQKMEYQRQLAEQERVKNAQLISSLFPGMMPGSAPQAQGMMPQGAEPQQQGLASMMGTQPAGMPSAPVPIQGQPAMTQRPTPQPVSPQAAGIVGMMTGAKPELMKLLTQQDPATESVEKGRGEGLAKRYNTLAEESVTASQDIQNLQRLNELSNNVSPGAKTAAMEHVRKWTGIALDPNASNVQAFGAAVNYMIPRMRVPGSGASSDRDMEIFRQSLPTLLGTPDGNQMALQTLGGMAQRKMQAGEVAAAWQRGEINAQQADTALRSLPDPFQQFKSWQDAQKTTQPQKMGGAVPKPGEVRKGYRFKGGNPADQNSWEKVQ